MTKFLFRSARFDEDDYWSPDWPSKECHVSQHEVTVDQRAQLSELIQKRAGERVIEDFLGENREVLALALGMFATGHHMSWVYPKQQIRPPAGLVAGLIPDYLMAGASSDGVAWFVLELKGADKQAFKVNGHRVLLSGDANEGVCQLLNYIDIASRDQAHLRDGLQLIEFREPTGILLIGTEDESRNPKIREFKAAWNRNMPRTRIRSYNALLRQVEAKLHDFGRL